MSNNRTFGQLISGNRKPNHEFSPEAEGAMLAMLEAGKSGRKVAEEFSTTHSAVQKIQKRFLTHHTVENKKRKGRPHILNNTEKRYIIRMAMKDRDITWDALTSSAAGSVSRRTIRRVIHTYFKRKWKAMDRPKLDKERAKVRLQWCRAWLPNIEELVQVRRIKV